LRLVLVLHGWALLVLVLVLVLVLLETVWIGRNNHHSTSFLI
jgi:hypothetical protein